MLVYSSGDSWLEAKALFIIRSNRAIESHYLTQKQLQFGASFPRGRESSI